jgi:hypothetical protein
MHSARILQGLACDSFNGRFYKAAGKIYMGERDAIIAGSVVCSHGKCANVHESRAAVIFLHGIVCA